MKLATFQSYIVKNPPPSFGGLFYLLPDNILRHHWHWRNLCRQLCPRNHHPLGSIFQRYLESQNPFQIEQFCRRAHGSGFSHRPDHHFKALSAD